MAIICCTARLLKELRVFPVAPDDEELQAGTIGPWYGNVLRIHRKKCLLFTNAKRLYCFFVPGVRRPALNSPDQLFRTELANALAMENLPAPCVSA